MSLYHFLKHGSFSHEFQNGRDRDGRLTEQCVDCGFYRVILGAEIVKGPAHIQQVDYGARLTKAKRVTKQNITPFERQSQR
jgi:hypothetical protein